MNAMNVERIFTSPQAGAAQVEHAHIRVVAGSGIEGDRYFGRSDEPGQNLSLIEIEEIEAFLLAHQLDRDAFVTRRNLLTRGVRLNALVGVEFRIGDIRVRGVELCEPCLGLGEALSSPCASPADVVKHLVHRGGLRVDVLDTGVIARGATIAVPPRA